METNGRRRAFVTVGIAATLMVTIGVAAAVAAPGRRHARVVAAASDSSTTATDDSTSTTSTTSESTATDPTPRTTDTPTTDAPCTPPGALDSPANLVSTIDFDRSTVTIGDHVGYSITVENPHDVPVAFASPLGLALFSSQTSYLPNGFQDDLDIPQGEGLCYDYFVLAPHEKLSGRGTFSPDPNYPYEPGHLTVQLWTQTHMVPLDKFGGPGGAITLVAPPETTTTL